MGDVSIDRLFISPKRLFRCTLLNEILEYDATAGLLYFCN